MTDSKPLSRELLRKIVRRISNLIETEKQALTNRQLIECCGETGRMFDGVTDGHLYHELAETALNALVAEKYGAFLLNAESPEKECTEILRPLQARLPTQAWRSESQVDYQQFSTPAPIAYLMAYLVSLQNDDIVLEPSCGTGSLAVWARAAGANVVTNEIDQRRRELLRLLEFDPTAHNAEYIDDFLAVSLRPNVLLINPPFSSNGGRTRTNSSKFGFRHVDSALRRLEPGGRFGAILGMSGLPRTKAGNQFWSALEPEIIVQSVIEIDGREYYRNGTSVNTVLIIGQKLSGRDAVRHTATEAIVFSLRSVEEAFAELRPLESPL